MPDLEKGLRESRERGRKLVIPYLMGGMTDDWVQTLAAVAAAGADAVEVGVPFSDPMMDGPVIQEAALRALRRGTVPEAVLDGIARADVGVPVAVMTYYNLVFRAGHRRMARSLAACGVSGTILPDLPIEEIGPWAAEADAAGIATVLLVAPSSPPDRVARICARAAWVRLRRRADGRDRGAGEPRRRCRKSGRAGPRPAPTCRCASALGCRRRSRQPRSVPSPTASSWVRHWYAACSRAEGPDGAGAFVTSLRRAID